MRIVLLVLIFVPLFAKAQRKKKQTAIDKANAQLVTRLTNHVKLLASDSLEGRRTGTIGEIKAQQYIAQQFMQLGLQPAGTDGYLQKFVINEGKQIHATETYFKVGEIALTLSEDYFPLAFSAGNAVKANAWMSVKEQGSIWLIDVQDWLEENKANPHYVIEDDIKKEANRASGKGAVALVLYNSGKLVDNILYNKNDASAALALPVFYLTTKGFAKTFTDATAGYTIEAKAGFRQVQRNATNVVGFIDNKAAHTVILGAHYDHLGYGEDGNQTDPQDGMVIHNGADDNASGTAALIELGALLQQTNAKQNNYLFIAFSGEELGLMGSKWWLDNPSIKISANYMINMDMIGRYDTAHKLTIGGYGTSPTWGSLFNNLQHNLIVKFDSTGSGPSDHASFYRKDIPVLFFFTGSHSDYHKAGDDWEKVNFEAQKNIVQLIVNIVEAANQNGKLSFTKTAEPQMARTRFNVSLGVVPDYGYTGTGLRIEGVSKGKIGEKIGLQAGDVLLQLGDYKFVDVNSYMTALSKFKKGDKTILIIKRKDQELQFNIEF
jgi:aminopeptidase YwaD